MEVCLSGLMVYRLLSSDKAIWSFLEGLLEADIYLESRSVTMEGQTMPMPSMIFIPELELNLEFILSKQFLRVNTLCL